MRSRRTSPKAEYRLRQNQRINDSANLSDRFPKLKSLTMELAYFEPDGQTKNGEMRYKVNVQHAKSLFSFPCHCGECIGGDFDLSDAVADAVSAHRKTVEGQLQCQGLRTRPKEPAPFPCHNLLRYRLSLGYA